MHQAPEIFFSSIGLASKSSGGLTSRPNEVGSLYGQSTTSELPPTAEITLSTHLMSIARPKSGVSSAFAASGGIVSEDAQDRLHSRANGQSASSRPSRYAFIRAVEPGFPRLGGFTGGLNNGLDEDSTRGGSRASPKVLVPEPAPSHAAKSLLNMDLGGLTDGEGGVFGPEFHLVSPDDGNAELDGIGPAAGQHDTGRSKFPVMCRQCCFSAISSMNN